MAQSEPTESERSTKPETERWHLECIPRALDRQVRQRQLDNRKKYLCQQVVADLEAYYQILALRELMGDDKIR